MTTQRPLRQAALGRDGRLLLTLGEAASRLDTGPLGIERLIEEGLLEPAEADARGRVWFDPVDIDAVMTGKATRQSGARLRSADGGSADHDDPDALGQLEPRDEGSGPPTRQVIILVDDDDDLRDTNALILEREGYEVRHASDGAEALAILREQPGASLIVLDLHMPTMDGWAFRRAQLDDDDLRPIPVLVLTADRTSAPEAIGAAALLLKPLEPTKLLASVREQLK